MIKSYLLKLTILFSCLISFLLIVGCSGGSGGSAAGVSAAGSLDTAGFNAPNGYVTKDVDTSVGTHTGWANAVTVQSDGKIVVVGRDDEDGQPQFVILRYNTDGSLDSTFGSGGQKTLSILTHGEARAVAMQTIGGTEYIIVAGYVMNASNHNLFAVARLNKSNGSLDTTSFGGGTGYVTAAIPAGNGTNDQGYGVAIDGDGKIVVAGYSDTGIRNIFAVARFTADGSGLDTTFGNHTPSPDGTYYWDNGMACEAHAVAIQDDGKIVVGGWQFVSSTGMGVFRLYADGSDIDHDFNAGNPATAQINSTETKAYALALQSDGKIVAAGYTDNGTSNYSFALARFTTAGVLDATFNPTGNPAGTVQTSPGTYDRAWAVVIQPDDQKIIAGGYSTTSGTLSFTLVRYTPTGSLDTTFGTGGIVKTVFGSSTNNIVNGLALQSDGKIVAVGLTYIGSAEVFATARYGF